MGIAITAGNVLLVGAILLFASIIVSKAGSRFGIPVLLLFLVVGMVFGSEGIGIEFTSAKIAQFIGMVALCVILFSGGMDTKIADIKPVILPGIILSTVGVLLTALITGTFIYLITKSPIFSLTFSFPLALLLASTMSSTDSASVFNVLRSQRLGLKNNLRPLLELESGSNDPVAYMMTIALIGALQFNSLDSWQIALKIVVQLVIGAASGRFLGRLAVRAINRINLANKSLYPILLLAFVFFIFAFTDLIQGNGYLAVYLSGIMVGKEKLVRKMETTTFLDGLTWLAQMSMFLVLGLLVRPHQMFAIAPIGLLIGAFLILVARPMSVFLALAPFKKISGRSKLFISWVGLRGAAPIIFATYPVVANIEGAEYIFNIVFFITILSLIIQGSTIPWVARALRLTATLENTENDFGVVFPEEIDSKVWDEVVTESMLRHGNRLMDLKISKDTLVIFIKRKEIVPEKRRKIVIRDNKKTNMVVHEKIIIPKGSVELQVGDKLLLIRKNMEEEPVLES